MRQVNCTDVIIERSPRNGLIGSASIDCSADSDEVASWPEWLVGPYIIHTVGRFESEYGVFPLTHALWSA